MNVNWNSDNDKWNVNDWTLDENCNWNAGNRVFSRNIIFLLRFYFWEVFFSNPFFQPPSILPISSSCVNRAKYFSVGTHLFSQAICKKNFTLSSFEIAIVSLEILVSGGR